MQETHFGHLVNEVINGLNLKMNDVATKAGISMEKLEMMLNRDEWTNNEIKHFSVALNHDLGKYLAPWDIKVNAKEGYLDANYYFSVNLMYDGEKLDKVTACLNKLSEELNLKFQ